MPLTLRGNCCLTSRLLYMLHFRSAYHSVSSSGIILSLSPLCCYGAKTPTPKTHTHTLARAFAGDVTSEADVKRVVASTIEAFTKVDVLVNSAGVLQGGAMGDGADVANFDFNMNVNAKGTFMFMMECVPSMKAAGAGSIVNVSSVNGMQSFQGTVAYCASKAAVDMMSRCAAVDLAPHKIRVNTINPGVVVTELQKRGGLDEAKYEAFLERSKTVTHPLGRVAEADEVAEAILFLASDKSGFITGAHLPIDGGRRCLGAR